MMMMRKLFLRFSLRGCSSLLGGLAAFLLIGTIPANVAAQSQLNESELTESEQIIHVLNRLAYGPRPGDFERVQAMGIAAYIEEQLSPETILDPIADDIISGYPITGKNLSELADNDRPAVARAERRRHNVRQRAQRAEQQMSGESGGYVTDESNQVLVSRRNMLNAEISAEVTRFDRGEDGDVQQVEQLIDVRLLRAVFSERQLLEMMVDFWVNHFNIDQNDLFLAADFSQNVIRPNALGNFEDLLIATATHPAMMNYLDNWLSSAPEETVQKRLAAGHEVYPGSSEKRALAMRARQDYFDRSSGLNENYGRELMELHTLGVNGGYTQEDVVQVAKSFTGWTIADLELGATDSHFIYDPLLHEGGDKVVLGETISAGGMDEGMKILKMLAHHPSTARHISTKLVRRFVADNPPEELVDAASSAFIASGGDIGDVLRAIFSAPEFYSREYYLGKMKKPIELVVSALRAVGADIEPGFGVPTFNLNQTLTLMGEPLYQHPAPDGFPDVASAWISTNTLFKRMDYAIVLSTGSLRGVSVDIEAAQSLFQQLGFPIPTPDQMLGVQFIAQQMSGNMMTTETADDSGGNQNNMMQESEPSSTGREISDPKVLATVVALGSPRFQKR